MEVKKVVTGSLDENCYILIENKTCLIVDPGDDYLRIMDAIGDNKILGILLTHSHFDHVGALRNFLNKKSIKIFKKSNLEEKQYQIGDFLFECVFTPGHSNDSVSFYFKNNQFIIVGDFIFKGSIGRTDLPGGNDIDMKNSIKKIFHYSENIIIYPGHGDRTTLKEEKYNNPYVVNMIDS